MGIKLCIKSLYLSYNEILAYREDKKDVSRIDINHYLSILRKSPIEIKYLVGYLGSNDKYHYSSKFVSVGNVDQCADEILHSIVCILNRFLDYANED
ncbi:MAG: hypothetical protein GY756_26930 [bacterium]|nr:hypothetical protein [bacterium]